jgi:mannosylglycerate hydrolase
MKTIHLISGTHWDREWRHTAEQSKLRLMDLMDYIIKVLEEDKTYHSFTIDGGLVVIEDYLAVRPENRERIEKLIKEKKLFVVNWYTLPELNTVAPESLIRNIQMGKKMADSLGGAMQSGYTATSYGQPSQVPQLYEGFDIPNAIFYRGTNKHILTPLFNWKAPDGSQIKVLRTFDEVTRTNWYFYVHDRAVLGKGDKDLSYTFDKRQIPVHMADLLSYEKAFTVLKENGDYIHDRANMKGALDALISQAEPYAVGDNILAMNIEDNDEPYWKLGELVDDMNKIYPGKYVIKQTTFDDYMATISALADKGDYQCADFSGELRFTTMEYNNFNGLLGATHSSRINIKLANEVCETNLIDLAEPLASVASIYGKEYPATNFERAWKALLKNHAHDSICGAAVDQAHKDMMYNFSLAKTVAEEVTNRSCVALYGDIDTASKFKQDDYPIIVFNTLPFKRHQVVELVIDTPKGKVIASDNGIGGAADLGEFYDIVDEEGNVLPFKEISRDNIAIGVERQLDTKSIKFDAVRKHVLVEMDIPECGYRTLALRPREPILAFQPQLMEDRKLIAREDGVLENDYLQVRIRENGTYDILNKKSGKLMQGLGFYSDQGEVGSAHISVGASNNYIVTSLGAHAQIDMMETNLLRGSFRIQLTLQIPSEATLDGHDRSKEMKSLPIETLLTLEKDSPVLKVHTKLVNASRDHKLWVNFPTELTKAQDVFVESSWDVVRRDIRWKDHKDNFEQFFPFQPMQNFVDVNDGSEGFAFLSRGLREYEVEDNSRRTLKITLIRTQRAYMTANAKMREEETQKYTGQHCLGEMEYDFALYPHEGTTRASEVIVKAYENKVPLKAISGVPNKGTLPSTLSFVTLVSQDGGLMPGAFKLAENGKDYIYRIWNADHERKKIGIQFNFPVKSVTKVKLNEEKIKELKLVKTVVSDELRPAEIASYLVKVK